MSDPLADDDLDGISNALEYALEYALGGTNGATNAGILPVASVATYTVGVSTEKYLTLTVRRPFSADQAAVSVEWTAAMVPGSWQANGALVSSTDHGDGTKTEVWRCPSPMTEGRYFGRIKVALP